MSQKKRRNAHHRKNPLKQKSHTRLDGATMNELGEQILAIGLGNMLLDMVYPKPDGPRRPCLSLSPIKSEEDSEP